jgi:hypothetical protein
VPLRAGSATAGCVLPPEPGSSAPLEADVVAADARALAYGRTAGDILENPQLRDKVHALFGADWAAPTPGVGKLSAPAAQYFELGGPVRMVRIGDAASLRARGLVARDVSWAGGTPADGTALAVRIRHRHGLVPALQATKTDVVSALKEERDVIRTRVADMLDQLEALNL